jgi:hypothetical protein
MAIVAVQACSESALAPRTPSRPVPSGVNFVQYYGYDSATRCYFQQEPNAWIYAEVSGKCSQTVSATNDSAGWLAVSENRRGPFHVTFSKPVYHVWIIMGVSYECGTDSGTVQYVTTGGDTVVRKNFYKDSLLWAGGTGCAQNAHEGGTWEGGGGMDSLPTDEGIVEMTLYPPELAQWEPWPGATFYSRGMIWFFFDRYTPCPPTGDSLLDNPRFRDSLRVALGRSLADTTPSTLRREVGGWLFFDEDGNLQIRFDYSNSTPCSVDITFVPHLAVGSFHIHPFRPVEGSTPAEQVPAIAACNGGGFYDTKSWGGPSARDWRGSVDNDLPEYVMDKKRIYRTNPNVTDSTLWADSTKTWDWNTDKCHW